MVEFFCGFETGTIAHDTVGNSGVPVISTSSPRTGNYCLTIAATGTATCQVQFQTPNTLPGNLVVYTVPFAFRVAVRVNTLPASGGEEIISFQGRQVRVHSDGTLNLWRTSPSTLQLASGSTVLSVGTWYVVEVVVTSTDSKMRVYETGHPPGADEWSGIAGSTGSSSVALGKTTNRNGNTISYSFDDFRGKDGTSSYLGDGKCILVKGNVSGPPTYDAFTKSTGTDIAPVWSDVPFSTATFASSAANADTKQSMWHNNIFPLSAPITINGVRTSMVVKNASGGPTVEELHLVGGVEVTSGALNFGGLTGDVYFGLLWPSVPSIHDLNGSQIGVFRHAGSVAATTVEDCWLQVDYSAPIGWPGGGTTVVTLIL